MSILQRFVQGTLVKVVTYGGSSSSQAPSLEFIGTFVSETKAVGYSENESWIHISYRGTKLNLNAVGKVMSMQPGEVILSIPKRIISTINKVQVEKIR